MYHGGRRGSSLSDSELDYTDGDGEVDSLSNHSHFFSPVAPRRRIYTTVSPAHTVEGRLAMPEPAQALREEDEATFNFDNRAGLAHDLGFLASMPELCDVTFLVGEDRQPVCGVRAVLAARSKVFRRMLFDEPQQSNIAHGGSKKKKRAPVKTLSEAFIEKYDFRGQPTVVIQDFDPEVFKQLMEYIHTGVVALQSRTLLGLMNAADHYGLEELKLASIQFLERAINTDTVCSLLSSAEKYIQYKSTKILVQKMLDYVDHHAEVVLSQSAFASLPQHVVRLVLGREELQACEESKFEAAFRWCVRYVGDNTELDLKTAFEPFVSQIEFHKIPVKHLMQRVKAAEVVDDAIILTALAYQADPTSVDTKKLNVRFRRVSSNSTLDGGQPPGPTHDYFQSGFRRVQSLGVVKSSPQPEDSSDSTDGEKHSRGGSVPPPDLRTDAHPSRVFEIRAESQASELSLSSADSTNSLSSVPHSPTMGRSTSSSSYSNVSAETADSHKLSNASENFITMSSNSVEV